MNLYPLLVFVEHLKRLSEIHNNTLYLMNELKSAERLTVLIVIF